ncbi:hypothetical protein FJ364_00590 [Candidatus Dependentiae bacterium]|nr:hypothetical protein [Candidatus Dependentiae bacterium]
MPNYKTHLIGGVMSFLLVMHATTHYMPTLNLSIHHLPYAFVLSLLGSIFPDIDVPSKMQKLFFTLSTGGILLALLIQNYHVFTLFGVSIIFVSFLTHRTITHKTKFVLLISLLPVLYTSYHLPSHTNDAFALYLYFTLGCLSHILFDKTQTKIKRLLGKKRKF